MPTGEDQVQGGEGRSTIRGPAPGSAAIAQLVTDRRGGSSAWLPGAMLVSWFSPAHESTVGSIS